MRGNSHKIALGFTYICPNYCKPKRLNMKNILTKTSALFFIPVMMLILFSCSSSDGGGCDEGDTQCLIVGKWNLSRVVEQKHENPPTIMDVPSYLGYYFKFDSNGDFSTQGAEFYRGKWELSGNNLTLSYYRDKVKNENGAEDVITFVETPKIDNISSSRLELIYDKRSIDGTIRTVTLYR